MKLRAAGLRIQPFRTHGDPLIFVPYASQRAAFEFLGGTHTHDHGLGLIQGPALSGKTTIIRHFTDSLRDDCAVSVVDGAGMNTTALMQLVLSQFGYQIEFNSPNELINMVRVFVMQQAATGHVPLLVIENTHALSPSALGVLCEFAALKVKEKSALRLILASDQPILPIVRAPAMTSISERLTGCFRLGPLTQQETRKYIHTKLHSGGCKDPGRVVPRDVCDELHSVSGGWPGIVDRLALLALAKAERCPIQTDHIEWPALPHNESKELIRLRQEQPKLEPDDLGNAPPRIILTYRGKTLDQVSLGRPRLLVGRSEHNDLRINGHLISRHHALFIRHRGTTVVMDLNSKNGTYVNSRRISNQVLIDNDIISIGDHRIKFKDPGAKIRTTLEGTGFNETMIAKTLEDMRDVLAGKNTKVGPLGRRFTKSARDTA